MPRSLLVTLISLSWSCSDTGVKAFNAEPEAAITSHSDGDEVFEGYTESFRGAVSDPDHASDDLTATWYLDGEVVCESDTPDSAGISSCDVLITSTASEVTLEVQDPENAAGSDQITLTVIATESPEAEITAPAEDGVYYSDQLITFEGVISDGEDIATDLVAAWESSLDGELEVEAEPNDDGEVTGFGYLSEGEHAVELNVTDTTGKTGSDSVIVTVGPPNSAPTCTITAPETNSADEEGSTVLFEATVDDVDVPANWLSVVWSSDKDGEIGESTPDSSGGVAFLFSDLTVESHVITLTVTDEVGADCSDYIIYSVGTPPSISIEAPTSGDVVDDGDVVTFQAEISDGEDTPTDLSMSWESNLDGEFSTQGSDSTGAILFTESGLSVGTHTLTATVTDTDGLYAQGVVLLQVNGVPTAPEVELTPDPATTTDDLVVTITADATDADGDPISYSYAWYVDGVASSASTSSTLSSADTSRDQTWTVEVTPNDGYSDGPAGSDDLTIGNTAPEVSDVEISPSTATVNDELSCSYTFSDADGDADASTIEWDVDGTVVGSDATLSSGYVGGSVVTCTVTAQDGTDEGNTESDSISIDNTAPVLADVTLSPEPAYEGDTLACTPGEVEDEDGPASFSYTYAWTVDGTDPGETTDTLSSDHFDRDQDVICLVTPNDGTEDGDQVPSNTVTIDNTAPSIDSVSITPDPATVSDSLSCSYSGWDDADADADADTTYAWAINGTDVGTGTTLSSGYVGGDTVTCTVTPDDGTDSGEALSASIEMDNTAPELSSVSLTPTAAYEGDTLTCTPATATDADGETVSYAYAWSVDGTDPGVSSDTLDSTYFDRDQDVFCTVTPSDDSEDGDAVDSNTVTISNTAPRIDSVAVSPNPATASDTLSCSYSGFEDADDDSDASTLAWTVNGSSMGTDSTLEGAFTGGDVVACTVTPDDGTDTGTALSDSVTIENTAPVLDEVTLAPDPAYEDDTLVCNPGTSTDADGTTSFTYTYAWTVNGLDPGETSSQLEGDAFDRGDPVYCTVTPHDGTDDGDAVDSNTVTISNTAPEITSVVVDPDPAYHNSELVCGWSFYDEDGDDDESTMEWTVDGVSVGTHYILSEGFETGDEVTCTVTAHDGTDAGTSDSASVTIENTAPEVTEVTLSPSTVYTDDTLTASVSTDDAEGDDVSLTYDWYVDGTMVATGSGTTLSGVSYFDKDEEVYVVVTPSDGIEDGDSVTSDSVVVSNTLPEAPEVTVSTATSGTEVCRSGLAFDGSNEEGLTSVPSAFHGSGTKWVGMWVYSESEDGVALIHMGWDTSSGVPPGGQTFSFRVAPDILHLDVSQMNASSSTLSFPMESWRFVYGSWNGSAYEVGVYDGSSISRESLSLDSQQLSDGVLNIGGAYDLKRSSWSAFFTGTITEVQLRNSIPSDSDIMDMADGLLDPTSVGGLEIYWATDEGSGSTANDSSGNSQHLSLNTVGWGEACSIEDEEEVLLCSIDTESTDADGDDITYTFEWEVDGVAYTDATTTTETGDTVPSSDYSGGETWTCTVTPNDGEDDGDSASAEYEVEGCSDGAGEDEDCPGTDCLQILEDGFSTGDGDYWIDPDGTGAFEAYCDMTTDDGGWTAFYAGINGETIDYFENNSVTCPAPDSECIRPTPDAVDTSYSLAVRCGSTMFSTPMVSDLVDYFHDGSQAYWVTLSSTSVIDGSLSGSIEAFWAGISGTANPGWMVGPEGGSLSTASSTFATAYLDSRYDYCNGSSDTSSEIYLFYRRAVDGDGDGYTSDEDCDDDDATVYPYAGDAYGDGVDSDCDGLDCEADTLDGAYFAFCPDDKGTWSTAEALCQSSGYDGLTSILSSDEQDFLNEMMADTGLETTERPWIGLLSSDWNTWTDGNSVSYTNWAPGEPSGTDCGHMNRDRDGTGTWNDVPCSDTDWSMWCGLR